MLEDLGPIAAGRELLLQSWTLLNGSGSHGVDNARIAIGAACSGFMEAMSLGGEPFPMETMSGGRILEWTDAAMWFGIGTSMLLPLNGRLTLGDGIRRVRAFEAVSDPLTLEVTSSIYENLADYKRAGRCAEELAEVMRLKDDPVGASTMFARAIELFERAGEPERAEGARRASNSRSNLSSPFFHRGFGGGPNTIAGSAEFLRLSTAVAMG